MGFLVTGATGFVGKEIVSLLNADCRLVVRNDYRNTKNSDDFVVENIDSQTNWQGAFKGIDCIIHLAGLAHSDLYSEQDYDSVNHVGTLHLAIEAANAGVKRLVFVSSIGVNGATNKKAPFTKLSKPSPSNAYAWSKYKAELGLGKIAKKTGLEVVIVRPTLVYGPNAPGNFEALTQLINTVPLLPFGFTINKRNFISVQNLAHLLSACATHPDAAGHTFLASESETVSTKEFTNAIAKGLGKKVYQLPVPVSLMRFAGKLLGKSAMVEQLVGNLQVDSSDLKKVLGWTPPYTMEESMALLKKQSKESK